MRTRCSFGIVLALLLVTPAATAQEVKGVILQQEVNAGGHGHTVMRVWGTQREMGRAYGYLLGPEIVEMVEDVRAEATPAVWSAARDGIPQTAFLPTWLSDHLEGVVAGMIDRVPASTVDVVDLQVLNTTGDWWYAMGCRSHSCWGDYVTPPVVALSTKRTDWHFLDMLYNHVLCGYDPEDGSTDRWANLSLPGMIVAVGAAVRENGTMVAIQDYQSGTSSPIVGPDTMTRSVASFNALLMDLPADPAQHLGTVYAALQEYDALIGGFLCYYAPGGHGGVMTSSSQAGFYDVRRPQASYFGGQVLITANAWTDGTYPPSGAEYLHDFYAEAGPKSLPEHWDVTGDPDNEIHQLSVAYRAPNDMTLWFNGKIPSGRTPRVEVEWSDLYEGAPPDRDAGVDAAEVAVDAAEVVVDASGVDRADAGVAPPVDGARVDVAAADRSAAPDVGVVDAEPPDAAGASGNEPGAVSEGCGCSTSRSGGSAMALLLMLIAVTRIASAHACRATPSAAQARSRPPTPDRGSRG